MEEDGAGIPKEEEEQRVDAVVDWAVDPDNARNWSFARKAVATAVVSGIGFVRYEHLLVDIPLMVCQATAQSLSIRTAST